jgi:hypothetical protein
MIVPEFQRRPSSSKLASTWDYTTLKFRKRYMKGAGRLYAEVRRRLPEDGGYVEKNVAALSGDGGGGAGAR